MARLKLIRLAFVNWRQRAKFMVRADSFAKDELLTRTIRAWRIRHIKSQTLATRARIYNNQKNNRTLMNALTIWRHQHTLNVHIIRANIGLMLESFKSWRRWFKLQTRQKNQLVHQKLGIIMEWRRQALSQLIGKLASRLHNVRVKVFFFKFWRSLHLDRVPGIPRIEIQLTRTQNEANVTQFEDGIRLMIAGMSDLRSGVRLVKLLSLKVAGFSLKVESNLEPFRRASVLGSVSTRLESPRVSNGIAQKILSRWNSYLTSRNQLLSQLIASKTTIRLKKLFTKWKHMFYQVRAKSIYLEKLMVTRQSPPESSFFHRWLFLTRMNSAAKKFEQNRLLRGTFRTWRTRSHILSLMMKRAVGARGMNLLREYWLYWIRRRHSLLLDRYRIEKAVNFYRYRFAGNALLSFKRAIILRKENVAKAAILFLLFKKKMWFGKWRRNFSRQGEFDRLALNVKSTIRIRYLKVTFHKWVAAHHARVIMLQRDQKYGHLIVKQAFHNWSQAWKRKRRITELMSLITKVASSVDDRTAQNCFQAWKRIGTLNSKLLEFQKLRSSRLLEHHGIRKGSVTSNVTVDFICIKFWFKWKAAHTFGRVQVLLDHLKLKRAFQKWLRGVAVPREAMARAVTLALSFNRKKARELVWYKWRGKLERRLDMRRQAKLKRQVLTMWHHCAHADKVWRVSLQRRLLAKWTVSIRKTRELKTQASNHHVKNLKRRMLFKWWRMANLKGCMNPITEHGGGQLLSFDTDSGPGQMGLIGGNSADTTDNSVLVPSHNTKQELSATDYWSMEDLADTLRRTKILKRSWGIWSMQMKKNLFENERKLVFADTWAAKQLIRKALSGWMTILDAKR
ncbi:hypothetical protein HDU76_012930 [Blyttiomyces sp. JEL0837]|nr:hypothetical protein HDU76_012930 [Blyttiomyces sp. JEL0837]